MAASSAASAGRPRGAPSGAVSSASRSTTSPASTRPSTSSSRSSTSSSARSATAGWAPGFPAAFSSTAHPGRARRCSRARSRGRRTRRSSRRRRRSSSRRSSASARPACATCSSRRRRRARDHLHRRARRDRTLPQRRVGGISGGHDEREQTLNQILTEMDGFEPGTNVIVLAATNRPEVLDPALLRPGRFDRRIAVQPPDKNGRAEILAIHTRSVPLAPDVDLEQIAASTPGTTGADLALIVNEAALFAARRDHRRRAAGLHGRDREDHPRHRAPDRDDGRRPQRTAYHESGHALVGMLTPGADPVRKVSIIPRGQALGVTLSTPETDRYGYARDELVGEDQSGARRPCGRAGRLRRDDDRRRVGHPAADAGSRAAWWRAGA